MKKIHYNEDILDKFEAQSRANTSANVETLAYLFGKE